jgi:hypothetical protein
MEKLGSRAGSTSKALILRWWLILRAGDQDHPTTLQISIAFDWNQHTIGWVAQPLPQPRRRLQW